MNTRSSAGLEVKAAGRFKRAYVQHRLGSKLVGDCKNGESAGSNAGEQKFTNSDGTLHLEDEICKGIPD
jgi:hypothetical protein